MKWKLEVEDFLGVLFAAGILTAIICIHPTASEIDSMSYYEVPEQPTVEEQLWEDIMKMPVPEEETIEAIPEVVNATWRRTDMYTPTDEIKLSPEDQTSLYYICKLHNVPMAYALAIIESESQFDWEAIGSIGEVGVFQVNPINWDRFAEIDIDVHTHTGNLEAGVMILAESLREFGEMDAATMGFKCGIYRAHQLLEEGTRLSVCDDVVDACMRYEDILGK